MELTVPDKSVKFRVPRLNRSPEIQAEVAEGGIFDRFLNFYKYRPEVAGDVISGEAIGYLGMDDRAKMC